MRDSARPGFECGLRCHADELGHEPSENSHRGKPQQAMAEIRRMILRKIKARIAKDPELADLMQKTPSQNE
jgi:hypothetical protein